VLARSPNPATRSSYHAAASVISAEAARRISATAGRQSSASFGQRFGRRDRLGGSRPESRYSRSNFLGPKILGVAIELLVETLGEPQTSAARSFVGRERAAVAIASAERIARSLAPLEPGHDRESQVTILETNATISRRIR
jgi:hypothetical protein